MADLVAASWPDLNPLQLFIQKQKQKQGLPTFCRTDILMPASQCNQSMCRFYNRQLMSGFVVKTATFSIMNIMFCSSIYHHTMAENLLGLWLAFLLMLRGSLFLRFGLRSSLAMLVYSSQHNAFLALKTTNAMQVAYQPLNLYGKTSEPL